MFCQPIHGCRLSSGSPAPLYANVASLLRPSPLQPGLLHHELCLSVLPRNRPCQFTPLLKNSQELLILAPQCITCELLALALSLFPDPAGNRLFSLLWSAQRNLPHCTHSYLCTCRSLLRPNPHRRLRPDSSYPSSWISSDYLIHPYVSHFKLRIYSLVDFMYCTFVLSTKIKHKLTEIRAMSYAKSVFPTLRNV